MDLVLFAKMPLLGPFRPFLSLCHLGRKNWSQIEKLGTRFKSQIDIWKWRTMEYPKVEGTRKDHQGTVVVILAKLFFLCEDNPLVQKSVTDFSNKGTVAITAFNIWYITCWYIDMVCFWKYHFGHSEMTNQL